MINYQEEYEYKQRGRYGCTYIKIHSVRIDDITRIRTGESLGFRGGQWRWVAQRPSGLRDHHIAQLLVLKVAAVGSVECV